MNRPSILIQTVGRDLPALMVAAAIEQLGGHPIVNPQTRILGDPRFSLRLGVKNSISSEEGELSNVRSVWNRRFPSKIDMPADTHPADVSFLDQNARLFLKALGAAFDGAMHVNPLAAKLVTADKLSQLRSARRAGLQTPETLVTADPVQVRRFASEYGPICTKPFSSGVWRSPDHDELLFTTTGVLTEGHLRDDDAIGMVPAIYQPYVEKAYEVRMTVFGRYCAALKICSQATPSTVTDWRIDLAYLKSLEPITPPNTLLEKCYRAMDALNLRFGVFDFIVTPGGDWVFLEINEAGQFLWQEQYCDQCWVIEPFARFLMEAKKDFTWNSAERSDAISPAAMNTAVRDSPEWSAILSEQTTHFNEGIGYE